MGNHLASSAHNAIKKLNLFRLLRVATTRGALTLSSLGVYALLGNIHGPKAISDYAVYIASISLLGSLLAFGFPQMLMRRISINRNANKSYTIRLRSIYWQYGLAFILSFASVLSALCLLIPAPNLSKYIIYVLGASAFAINSLTYEELRGRGQAEAALIAFNAPLVFAPFLCSLLSVVIDTGNISGTIIFSHIATSIVVSLVHLASSGGICLSLRDSERNFKVLSKIDLLSMSIQKFISGGMSHLIILLTSAFGNPALTAFVAVAARLAGLAATFTGIINATFAKKVGSSIRSIERQKQLFLTTSAITVLGVSALMVPIVAFPSTFLAIFDINQGLEGATFALQILAIARIIRAFSGISDLFLMVSGQAYKELISAFLGILALLAGVLLYSADTAVGAALSLGQAVVAHGAISALFVISRASN